MFNVSNDSISGLGLIATEVIPKGTRLFAEADDKDEYCSMTTSEFMKLPLDIKRYFMRYAWYWHIDGRIYCCYGIGSFCNHSDNPTIDDHGCFSIKDIQVGEEITWDYRSLKCDEHGNYYSANFLHYDQLTIENNFLT